MSEVSKAENGKQKLTLQNYQWKTHYAYGKYLHENVLDAEPETLVELLQLADEYDDDTGLASFCSTTLLRTVCGKSLCNCLEYCFEMKFDLLAADLVKQGATIKRSSKSAYNIDS